MPDFDLLTGGVPCQAWSVAGKRGGFADPRGGMWGEFARALREKRPRFFIAENVRGLLSHDKGRSFEAIQEMLMDAGYNIQHQVLDARDFGVPQMRQRVFIVGFRDRSEEEAWARFRFPKPSNPGTTISLVLEQEVAPKYFLKPETAKKILARLKRPEEVLERLGISGAAMIKQNQRREVRTGEAAGTLPASQPASQAQFVVQQHHGEARAYDAARPITAGSDGDRQQVVLGSMFETDADGRRGVAYNANDEAQTLRSSSMTSDRSQFVLGAKEDVSYALDANYHKGPSSGSEGGRGSANKGKRTVVAAVLRNVNQRHGGLTVSDDVAPTLKSSDGAGLTRAAIVSAARGKFDGKVSEAAPAVTASRYDCNHLLALYDAGMLTLRRLTPLECERLQGWPDGWTSEGNAFGARGIGHSIDRMSDTQRYRMTGNGVAAPVVEAIVREIMRASTV
ncbi:MAG: hypothetical protein RIS45_847 [Planctomycetota bacterium]